MSGASAHIFCPAKALLILGLPLAALVSPAILLTYVQESIMVSQILSPQEGCKISQEMRIAARTKEQCLARQNDFRAGEIRSFKRLVRKDKGK